MAFEITASGILFLIALLVVSVFRVLREYERGVVFMLGRFTLRIQPTNCETKPTNYET